MRPLRGTALLLSLGLGIVGIAPLASAAAGEFVVVSATAAPEYRRTRGTDGVMPESYVFSPGIHFGGVGRDKTQETLPFLAVAQTLAAGLARQKYFPARDPAAANLVIVVHWGTTETHEDPNRQAIIELLNQQLEVFHPKRGDPPSLSDRFNAAQTMNELLADQEAHARRQKQFLDANAELLGYRRSLTKEEAHPMSREEEVTLRADLAEERYFVVLMAYDYQLLKKDKKPRLLWVTRMSVRSPGNNFADSVPGMTHIAADFFGQQRDDLTRVRTNLREGQVEIGELKVIGTVPEITPPQKAPE